jgi:acyl-CoA reductase-like NAD-dependent aldehyde dehydrogenase
VIDARQRDKIHGLVTASIEGRARLVAGGTYDGLFYRPTALANVTDSSPAYTQEVFGPVAPYGRSPLWTRLPLSQPTASTGCRWSSSPAM